jgi:hypothetical protein
MNSRFIQTFALFAILSVGLSAQTRNISTPAARQAALKTTETLLAEKPNTAAGAEALKDPFNPTEQDLREDYDPDAAAKDVKPVVRRSDADFLQELAKQIQPTGSVTLGGEPYLLFGEKRQKKGDKVTISYDGVEYVVEIVSIANKHFRLRYNNEEMVRSIK